MDVRLRPRAEQDVEDVAQWYEAKLAGLGLRFIDEVDRVLGLITELPTAYPAMHRDTRRALVPTFPFAIYYQVRSDHVVVIAIIHARRDPRSWRNRS